MACTVSIVILHRVGQAPSLRSHLTASVRFPVRTTTKVGIAAVAVIATLLVVFARPYEGRLFIVTKNDWYDVIGSTQAAIVRATRNCRTVSSLASSSSDWHRVKTALGEPTGGTASPIQITREGAWFLAESEFENAEPAIVLFEQTENGLVERASWGGATGPFLPEPLVWDHLRKAARRAPVSLIQCFERR